MAYKDPDKQREAQRDWVRQKRKGSTDKGSTSQGSTEGMTDEPSSVIPKQVFPKTTKFPTHKRGKDIKVFDDLPVDIRLIINRLSDSKEEKQRRTAVAINYQHQFSP